MTTPAKTFLAGLIVTFFTMLGMPAGADDDPDDPNFFPVEMKLDIGSRLVQVFGTPDDAAVRTYQSKIEYYTQVGASGTIGDDLLITTAIDGCVSGGNPPAPNDVCIRRETATFAFVGTDDGPSGGPPADFHDGFICFWIGPPADPDYMRFPIVANAPAFASNPGTCPAQG